MTSEVNSLKDAALDEALLVRVLGKNLTSVSRLKGGGNNRIFKLECADGDTYVAKCYHQNPKDPRDRLSTDYGAHRFLWDQGLRTIPEPIHKDSKLYYAIYRFIDGQKHSEVLLGPEDIEQSLAFIHDLKRLSKTPPAQTLPIASEAFFSLDVGLLIVMQRFERIQAALASNNPAREEFTVFVQQMLEPYVLKLEADLKQRAEALGIDYGVQLPQQFRILSPSDFGFHNALKTSSDKWIFFDLEYFGWDDPVKLTLDFLLHPGMSLSAEAKRVYLKGCRECFDYEATFYKRLRLTYPLLALKWALVLLNEFVPRDSARRNFALADSLQPIRERQLIQLEKARRYLTFAQSGWPWD